MDLQLSISENRALRFKFQRKAGEVLPNERVSLCCSKVIPTRSVNVRHSASNGRSHYSGLQVCGSAWSCPVCANKISERRRLELEEGIKVHGSNGGYFVFVTYTIRHQWGDKLKDLLNGLSSANRRMKQGATWSNFVDRVGLVGTVRALEVTYGQNGWHPHIHELFFLDREPDLEYLRSHLLKRWSGYVVKFGLAPVNNYGVDVRASGAGEQMARYLTKAGWNITHELTRSGSKSGRRLSRSPRQLLADFYAGDDRSGDLYAEYALAFKGSQLIRWSKGLKALLLPVEVDKTDEEVATEEQEDSVTLAVLSFMEWRRVRLAGLRAALLDVADGADPQKIEDWLVQNNIRRLDHVYGHSGGCGSGGSVAGVGVAGSVGLVVSAYG